MHHDDIEFGCFPVAFPDLASLALNPVRAPAVLNSQGFDHSVEMLNATVYLCYALFSAEMCSVRQTAVADRNSAIRRQSTVIESR